MFERLLKYLVENNRIQKEDVTLYRYGYRQGKVLLLNIVTILVIGLSMGMIWECIVFNIAYILLRSYSGGYHAPNAIVCYIISTFLEIGVFWCIRTINLNIFWYAVTIIMGSIVLLYAPIAATKKPLDELEQRRYQQISHWVLIFEIGIGILLAILEQMQYAKALWMAVVLTGGLLLVSLIEEKINLFHSIEGER